MKTVGAISAVLGAMVMSSGCAADIEELDQAVAGGPSTLNKQLARARAASAAYHDVDEALADGFVPASDCVEVPGLGMMGVHFVNFPRLADPPSIEEPEALLYLPDEDDGFRLVAIEYLVPILIGGAPYMGCGVENESCPPPAASTPPPPVLYDGITFDGPMAGHSPGMPWHYDLHVWIWHHNPSGMFAQFNPSLACP